MNDLFELLLINGDLTFWATVCKTVRPMLSDRCLSCLSVTLVHCGQTVGWIKKLGMQVGLGPGRIALDGDPAPPLPKGHSRSPQCSAHICCGQVAGWIKMPLGMEVGLGPGDFVLYRDPAPLPRKGAQPPPQVSAHVYSGQMAGWIKGALGTEVGLSPGHIMLDRDPAPSQKRGRIPQFSAMSIVAKRMDGSSCHLVRR